MLTLLSLNSVLIHSQCILWVSDKGHTLWKRIYLGGNLFQETLKKRTFGYVYIPIHYVMWGNV